MNYLINYTKVKRVLDTFLAGLGVIFSFPLWILISLAIWLEDADPIFYIQERVGLNGKVFEMIKFRTLNPRHKKNSLFMKFLRQTALDELPQLINILRGEMSFVGPRPLIPLEVNNTETKVDARLMIRPGLTGLAQIMVCKDAPVLEKFKYDLCYIKNHKLSLDIALILKSFWISLNRRWELPR